MSSEATNAMSEESKEKLTLVPQLRFPEFRERGGWTTVELGTVTTITTEKVGSNACIPMSITSGVGLVSQEDKFGRVIAGDSYKNYLLLKPNDFAYNKSATKEFPEGFLALYSGSELAAVPNSIFTCFRVKDQSPAPTYLKYLFLGNLHGQWLRKFIQVGARAHGSLSINDSDLMALPVPLPTGEASIAEQQKIADCLSSLDELITTETQKLDILKTHKRGMMQQLFPHEGETVPRLRFSEFREAGEWEEKPLAEVCNVLQGYGFPEVLQGRSEGKYPFCKVSDISRAVAEKGGLLDEAANYVGDDDISKLRARPIPEGATVFAKIGEALRLNRRGYVQKECLIDNNVTGLKAIDGVADDYFAYLLSQLIDLNRHCSGAVPSVNKTTLEAIEVVVPGPNEQKRIAGGLSTLDKLIASQSQKIDALKNHKQGLMQQLFPVLNEVLT